MPIKIIGSPEPRYLAATDILVSDMSNINYDFLLFDRPIVLIANEWLRKNFPDIGIKTDLDNLEPTIKKVISEPDEFIKSRHYWRDKTIYMADGKSTPRVLDVILAHSKIDNPAIILLHGNNEVSKVHLMPLYSEIKKRNIETVFTDKHIGPRVEALSNIYSEKCLIFISAHNSILNSIHHGFKVHIDHSAKGAGVTDFESQMEHYRSMDFYPFTDLHVTEGQISYERTKKLVGPYSDRVVLAGYPKSDTLLACNTEKNRLEVCAELGFDPGKLLVTYAPTGKYHYPSKQGASLSNESIKKFREIARKNEFNILVKLRSRKSYRDKIVELAKKLLRP